MVDWREVAAENERKKKEQAVRYAETQRAIGGEMEPPLISAASVTAAERGESEVSEKTVKYLRTLVELGWGKTIDELILKALGALMASVEIAGPLRRCVECDAVLEGKRADARFCGAGCRKVVWRRGNNRS